MEIEGRSYQDSSVPCPAPAYPETQPHSSTAISQVSLCNLLCLGIFCKDTQEANDTDYLWGGELGQTQERDLFATDPFKPFALLKQGVFCLVNSRHLKGTLKGSTSWDCVSINEDASLTIHFELCAGVNITTTFSTAGRYGFDLCHSFFCCVCFGELCWSVMPLVTPSIFQRAFRNGNTC